MMEKEGSPNRLVIILIGIIVVLALVFLYAFVLKPSITANAVKLQSQEDIKILSAIIAQVSQAGYITLPVPGTNQTVTLIPPQLCNQLMGNSSATSSG